MTLEALTRTIEQVYPYFHVVTSATRSVGFPGLSVNLEEIRFWHKWIASSADEDDTPHHHQKDDVDVFPF